MADSLSNFCPGFLINQVGMFVLKKVQVVINNDWDLKVTRGTELYPVFCALIQMAPAPTSMFFVTIWKHI